MIAPCAQSANTNAAVHLQPDTIANLKGDFELVVYEGNQPKYEPIEEA